MVLLRTTLALSMATTPAQALTPVTPCTVLARLPHATTSYTEGLFFRDGLFYEGTGLEGHSQVLIYKPTGQVLQHWEVPAQYFGEGIIDWRDTLLEWTWQSHLGFVLDRTSLRPTGAQFHYTGEGWGITRTPTELITSDGSATLRFRNPDTFDVTRTLLVKDGTTPIRNLNELEYIAAPHRRPEIYANVWHSDRIARISPADGHVIAWLDCTALLPASQRLNAEAVLNGIAYDSIQHRLFVTGKQWPTIFQIRLP